MVDGAVIKVLGGDDGLDNLLQDLLAEKLGRDFLRMLGRDDNGVNTDGDNSTTVVLVLNGDLGLGVGTQPGEAAVTASGGHGSIELVREEKGEREKLRGLVGGITEHDTLVTSTELLKSLLVVKTLSNILGLLLNGDKQVQSLVVETLVGRVITNALDGLTDNLLVIDLSGSGDLTEDHDHTSLGGSLASNLGEGVHS